MSPKQVITLLALIAWMFLDHAQAQHPAPPPYSRPPFSVPVQQQVVARSTATDAARYLAGLPIAAESPLTGLTKDSRWIAHSNVMNAGFSKLEQSLLNNIRSWQAEFLTPVTILSRTCLYFFSGPDFIYADTLYPNCNAFVMVSLEPIESLPELETVPAASLQNSLQAIEVALNTYLQFGYFETQDLRAYTQRSRLKGILPIIFVFLARSGKEILNVDYLSPSRGGVARGMKITFQDPVTGGRKLLYYFTADLSDGGLKSNQALLRFCSSLGPTNSFLKAPSYLLFQNGFNIARDFLLRVSATILQDDSGIPIRYFTPDRWILRFFGSYTGPLELFKKFYQPDLQHYYATSSPKPLPFGFGYQWNPHAATLILAVRR